MVSIKFLMERLPLIWVLQNQLTFLKALLFVMMDLTGEVRPLTGLQTTFKAVEDAPRSICFHLFSLHNVLQRPLSSLTAVTLYVLTY